MTIYLHIGSPKTGTTSFQSFCSTRRDEFLEAGILYPAALGKIAHTAAPLYAADFSVGFTAKRVRNLTSEAALDIYRETIRKRLYDEVAKSGCRHVLVSSEHLYVSVVEEHEITRLRDLFAPLQQEIKILVYLRRRDEFAMSLYAEAVRMGFAGSFDDYMKHERTIRMLDYPEILQRWAKVFGKSNVLLRAYDRKNLVAGDVIADLLTQVGAPIELANTGDKSQHMRESLGGDALVFLVRFNAAVAKLLRDETAVSLRHFRSPIVRETLAQVLEKGSNGKKLQLPPDVRARMFDAYRDADALLFADFGEKLLEVQRAPDQQDGVQLTLEAAIQFAARLWVDRECALLAIDPDCDELLQTDGESGGAARQGHGV